MKTFLITITLSIISALTPAHAISTRVEWLNTSGTELKDILGVTLTPGTALDGDGAVLQLGYYSAATLADPFAGLWVPMTGPGSGTAVPSTIGDKAPNPAGRFNISNTFQLGGFTFSEPLAGTPLAIRFYDSTSIGSSVYFNAVSNNTGAWDWKTPSEPQSVINISLSDSGITWEGGVGSAYRTTQIVPEPSSVALLLFGTALFARRRTLRKSERNG